MKVFYYGIAYDDYPRNVRIRRYLQNQGVQVTAHYKSRASSRLRRLQSDLFELIHGARRADVVFLAEFGQRRLPLVALACCLIRRKLVVDGFVGLYETEVLDRHRVRVGSLHARWLEFLDWLSLTASSMFLIDTFERAQNRAEIRPKTRILVLPVGAPSWSEIDSRQAVRQPVNVLYYGNYVPLHGLDVVLGAASLLSPNEVRFTLIGNGASRESLETQFRERVAAPFTFVDSVSELELRDYLAASDVVLGVFGDSAKARSVIANKVWQGLAANRLVITRNSPALDELTPIVGDQLVQISPTPIELADAIRLAVRRTWTGSSARNLAAYVDEKFAALIPALQEIATVNRHRP